MSETHRFSVSVAGAVQREDGRVLAIKRRDNGHWEPPGGVLDPGESLREGLVREVLEETGYRVKTETLTGVYQNMERDIMAFVFRCTVVNGQAHSTEESSSVEWLEADDVRARMSEAYAVRILDALTPDHEGPAIRTHDGTSLIG
jgi:8-oxo-dGTP pyrophosphatase MutT (NUDIX family)